MSAKPISPLTQWRKDKGWTLDQAAAAFGMKSKGQLSEIEGGGRCSVPLAMTIETVTDGAVHAHDLSPDVALVRQAA